MDLAIDEEETGGGAIEQVCGRFFQTCVSATRLTSGGFFFARTNGLRCERGSIDDVSDFCWQLQKREGVVFGADLICQLGLSLSQSIL